jgi:hypothetical protein
MSTAVMKLNKVVMTFKISQEGECTLIEEEVIFKTLPPFKPILENIFKKQHKLLFENREQSVC